MMRFSTYITTILLLLSAAFMLSGCEIESSENGNFDGFWHIERIDTLATQGTLDLSADRKFWSVQHRLIKIGSTLFYFERADGQLTLTEAPEATTEPNLKPYGVQGIPETFEVELLSSKRMMLKSEMLRICFKKY